MTAYELTIEDQEALIKEGLSQEQIQKVLGRLKVRPEPTPQEDELDKLIETQARTEMRRGGDVGTMMGWLTVQELIEDRRERRTLKANPPPTPQSSPEIKGLESKVDDLTDKLSKLTERWEKQEEDEARRKELEGLRGEIASVKTSIEELKKIPPKPSEGEESPVAKELKGKLDDTLKKVESLEATLKTKELEGTKTEILSQFKTDLDPIKSDLARMHGRLEEASTSKGITDRAMARELKILGGIDSKLDILTVKLPSATEASELMRQMQPPQVRTTPPRPETEKAKTYREAIQKLEEKQKPPKTEAATPTASETKTATKRTRRVKRVK